MARAISRWYGLMSVSGCNQEPARGFTLIEVVVALGIFGLGVLALIHIQTESVRASAEIRDRIVADIIAENILVESHIESDVASSRSGSGEVQMVGQTWKWTREFSGTANPTINRVDVAVARSPDDMTFSVMTAFKGIQ